MKLLIETSQLGWGGVALAKAGELRAIRWWNQPSVHAERVVSSLTELVWEDSPGRPQAILLSAGPGSFTGLRIGFAIAKGLSAGWGIPLKAMSTHGIIAEAAHLSEKVPTGQIEITVASASRAGRWFHTVCRTDAPFTESSCFEANPSEWAVDVRANDINDPVLWFSAFARRAERLSGEEFTDAPNYGESVA